MVRCVACDLHLPPPTGVRVKGVLWEIVWGLWCLSSILPARASVHVTQVVSLVCVKLATNPALPNAWHEV